MTSNDSLAGFTDAQIRFRARHAAIVYLAVERGWRPTSTLYEVARNDIALAPGLPQPRLRDEPPPNPAKDLRSMIVTRHPDHVEITVTARYTGDRWTALMMNMSLRGHDLEVTAAARAERCPEHQRHLQTLRTADEDDPDYQPPPEAPPAPQPPASLIDALRSRLMAVRIEIDLVEAAARVRDSQLARLAREALDQGQDPEAVGANHWAPRLIELDTEAAELTSRLADARRAAALDNTDATTALFGECPDQPHAAEVWHAAASELTEYRIRYGVTDPNLPYGKRVTESQDPVHSAERRTIVERISEYRSYLNDLAREHDTAAAKTAAIDL